MSDNQRTEYLSQYVRIMASISDTPLVVSKLTQIADRLDEQNERIKRLEEMYEGEIGENEQFLGSNLQGLLTRELNWSKERIKQLESWIESLEVLEQHSGILPEREWFGSEIGYLRKGEAVYKGEAKP